MRRHHNILSILLYVSIIVSVVTACSTQKNTSGSRWWHSFNAKYNTYYNGTVAYIEGSLAKENGNKDNYTELLPLYTVGNKASREIGKSNFETAVTKAQKAIQQHSIKKRPEWKKSRRKTERDIEWLSRREYNPFLWKAWMLMGRSQFHSGSFDEAAATFSYMSRLYRTQPDIYGKARAWLAKCYIEQDWLYDAEDVIRNMSRDSIDWRAQKEWDYTYADYYLHTGDFKQAATYLQRVIKHEKRSKQRAREWFLLGQIYAAEHEDAKAYNAFKRVVRTNPPYELEFNARIAMTEVMPKGQSKSKISRLKRMARSDKNKDYLDQVYYAIGNVYLAERDTIKAIGAYETGNKKATRSGIEKGVLLLHLGDLYWQIEKFGDAQRCYGEAIGLLDKDRKDYPQLAERSKVLDELAPFTEAVHLQDSLQALAKMSEKDRNAAIDRVIDALKKKEKEERLAELEKQAQQNAARGDAGNNNTSNRPTVPTMPQPNGSATWYFYNPAAVQQGKQTFQKQWGKRENADNWQRANKTVVASATEENLYDNDEASEDSISNDKDGIADSKTKEPNDTSALDPHKREYYLAQIPFTDEQVAESNVIIADGLFNSGIIFKDKLDNLRLSEKALRRLNTSFPEYEKSDELYYHLFLLYSRKGEPKVAAQFKDLLADRYPDSQWATIVNDPYFEENARYGTHREDSLYADTYEAFRNDQHSTISRNCHISEQRYPLGAHRDKFLFVGGLSRLNHGDADSCVAAMERVVKEYPQSEVSAIAGMIINGVKAGKKLRGAKFDIADIWNYRAEALDESNDTINNKFSDSPNEEFIFLMTYNADSLAYRNDSITLIGQQVENQLLYEVARYNFTSYLVRNFDIDIEDFQGMHRLSISGFQNYDEALVYARNLYKNSHIMELARGSRNIIISRTNLPLLGAQYSYNDYDAFYADHFAPLPQPDAAILLEQHLTPEQYDPEAMPSAPGAEPDNTDAGNNSGNAGASSEFDSFDIPEEPKAEPKNQDPSSMEIIEPAAVKPVQNTSTEISDMTEIVEPQPIKPTETKPVQQTTETKPVQQKTETKPVQQKTEPKPQPKVQPKQNTSTIRQDINADVLEIIDESAPKTNKNTPKKEEKKQKNDDEYFDFDGF